MNLFYFPGNNREYPTEIFPGKLLVYIMEQYQKYWDEFHIMVS